MHNSFKLPFEIPETVKFNLPWNWSHFTVNDRTLHEHFSPLIVALLPLHMCFDYAFRTPIALEPSELRDQWTEKLHFSSCKFFFLSPRRRFNDRGSFLRIAMSENLSGWNKKRCATLLGLSLANESSIALRLSLIWFVVFGFTSATSRQWSREICEMNCNEWTRRRNRIVNRVKKKEQKRSQ